MHPLPNEMKSQYVLQTLWWNRCTPTWPPKTPHLWMWFGPFGLGVWGRRPGPSCKGYEKLCCNVRPAYLYSGIAWMLMIVDDFFQILLTSSESPNNISQLAPFSWAETNLHRLKCSVRPAWSLCGVSAAPLIAMPLTKSASDSLDSTEIHSMTQTTVDSAIGKHQVAS